MSIIKGMSKSEFWDGYNKWKLVRRGDSASRIFDERYRGFRVCFFQGHGQYSYWTATYMFDSEWHSERLSSCEEVLAWIDEQHESEDFQEWEKEVWNNPNF